MALRVLVVEDDEDVAELFADMLRDLGHDPVLVRSAEAGRLALALERVDTILLDLRLPLMSGLDFLRLAPSRETAIPIIVMSGVATQDEARAALRRGALDFLRKPVSLELLHAALRYAEARSLSGRPDAAGRPVDRRRSRRASVVMPVRVVEDTGAEWESASVDLSAFGVKLARPHPYAGSPGLAVRLILGLPDGGRTLDILSALVRRERDAYVFRFVNLTETDFHRLGDAVGRSAAEDR